MKPLVKVSRFRMHALHVQCNQDRRQALFVVVLDNRYKWYGTHCVTACPHLAHGLIVI